MGLRWGYLSAVIRQGCQHSDLFISASLSVSYLFGEQLSVPRVINLLLGESNLYHRQLSHYFLLSIFMLISCYVQTTSKNSFVDTVVQANLLPCGLYAVVWGCVFQLYRLQVLLSLSPRLYSCFNFNWGMFPGEVAWPLIIGLSTRHYICYFLCIVFRQYLTCALLLTGGWGGSRCSGTEVPC